MEIDEPFRVWLWFGNRRPPRRQLQLLRSSGAPVIEVAERDPLIETEAIGKPSGMDELGGDSGAQLVGWEWLRVERDLRETVWREATLWSTRDDIVDRGQTPPDDRE